LIFTGLVFAFAFVADDCRGDLWWADASPVPIGGMRTESILGSGVVVRDFDGDFCRGAFDGLLTKEPVAIGTDLTYADIFFVGDGISSSDVSRSTMLLRFPVDEGPSGDCWGGWVACREEEEPSLARPEGLLVLDLRVCTDPRDAAGSSTCI